MRLCVFLENLEMARFRRYRKYTRRSHVKWSSRITNITTSQNVSQQQELFISNTLATNPAQQTSSISQKFTVKNVWMQFNIESQNETLNNLDNLQLFIMYVPQGYSLSSSMPYDHPEWIMAQKFIGTAINFNNPGYGPLSVSTRLARTLDTGDSIKWVLLGANNSNSSGSVSLKGICRYNTKAN